MCGNNSSASSNKSHPLKFVCIGIRTGADESVQSLTSEIERWRCVKDLKVEQVRKSYHSSTFRVQYNIPASLHGKWQDPKSWPSRISVSEWRGNPKTPIAPLKDRVYNKKIYIGNLPETSTQEIVQKNMESIYHNEMNGGPSHTATIQKIDVFWNEAGMKREKDKKSQDPSHQILKSACVVLTSYPGQPLTEISLKFDSFREHPAIRRTIRHWRGPTPGQAHQPQTNLRWQ